jgi:chorismate-pyruvate lyase
MLDVANPGSALYRSLQESNGTVTSFLEHLVGEKIDARQRLHTTIGGRASNDLQVARGEPLLHRAATLQGRSSGLSYLYAQSVIATSRLPTRFLHRIESTNDPIGRILDEMAIVVTRLDLGPPNRQTDSRPSFDVNVDDCLLTRTYRIDSEQTPVMIITEWFLSTLMPFLP